MTNDGVSQRRTKVLLVLCLSFNGSLSALSGNAALPTRGDGTLQSQTGKSVYEQHCAACHGMNGDGNGPASVWLFPKPRNFSAGMFKIQSTPPGSPPTDDDLFQTVTRGMPGSSMPSFTYLPEQDRRGVVEYLKHLTVSTNDAGERVNVFSQTNSGVALRSIKVPPEPPVTLQALTTGKEVFAKLQCATCHGETGAGDGPSAAALKDTWGLPLPPRDFNTGAFRGGHTGRDLYLRIHNGMAGTPMPPFGPEVMNADERWALVLYIQSLRRKDVEVNDILAPADGSIVVERVGKLPNDPMDRYWDKFDPTRVPLNPLWPEKDPIPAVAVRAVHDGRRIAILCQWRDNVANGAPIRIQDFQDAIALQFSLTGGTPFLGMGDANNPVNIWQWKAGWQQEIAAHKPDMQDQYVSMHVDIYPEASPLFRTAEAAQNVLSIPHKTSVEDANARGFGTLNSQPSSAQNVSGKGIWQDGHWSVLFTRDLRSRDKDDVKLTAERSVPIAFAVWDGQNRDRNGRKVISNWYHLKLHN